MVDKQTVQGRDPPGRLCYHLNPSGGILILEYSTAGVKFFFLSTQHSASEADGELASSADHPAEGRKRGVRPTRGSNSKSQSGELTMGLQSIPRTRRQTRQLRRKGSDVQLVQPIYKRRDCSNEP